jgi:hypothetical protein
MKNSSPERFIDQKWAVKLKSPVEVAEVLSVSYSSALHLMKSTSATIDLAKPRTRKRLLRIRAKHLQEYLGGKLK